MAHACAKAQRDIRQFLEPRPPVPIEKRFFPRDKLFRYLASGSPNIARSILECECDRCYDQLKRFFVGPGNSIDQYLRGILGSTGELPHYESSAVTLFSLFVAIGYPVLCRNLLDKGFDDKIFQLGPTAALPRDTLRNQWPMDDAEFDWDFYGSLEKQLAHFAVPHLTNTKFATYDSCTILPFVDEEPIGKLSEDGQVIHEGGFGKVFSFKIWSCYNKLGVSGPFARKQLLDANAPLRFELERGNHQIVDLLESPHIVKMITTYKHGNTFNIIFPRAKTDLNHFLREDTFGSNDLRTAPLELCPIWTQALGITTALGSISKVESQGSKLPNAQPQSSLIGFHFDLKPANILVDHDGTWLITDFGLAQFAPSDGSTSRVINQGGTDSYAPPECLNINGKFSRRYDVWSLGCVLLEVVAFAVDGQKGLQELDEARETSTNHRTDSRFYTSTPDGRGYILKPSIVTFKERLLRSERASHDSSKNFLHDVLALIDKMLEPLAENRIDINHVIPEFSGMVSSVATQSPRSHTASFDSDAPFSAEGERNLTSQRLREIICSHLTADRTKDGGSWRYVRLHLFGDQEGTFRLVASDSSSQRRGENLEFRDQDVQLIPGYAFPETKSASTSEIGIRFQWIATGKILHNSTFWFKGSRGTSQVYVKIRRNDGKVDSEYFQSELCNQEVVQTYELQRVILRRHTDVAKKAKQKVRRWIGITDDENEFDSNGLGPAKLQLLIESNEAFERSRKLTLSTPGSKDHPVRGRPQEELVPPWRLMVFVKGMIITIILKPGLRNLRDRPKDLDSKISRFVPTDPHRDRFIQVAMIHPVRKEKCAYAGIPLNVEKLRERELANTFDCKEVDFEFSSESASAAFQSRYLEWKTDWRNQRKEAESTSKMPSRSARQPRRHAGRGGVGNTPFKPENDHGTGL